MLIRTRIALPIFWILSLGFMTIHTHNQRYKIMLQIPHLTHAVQREHEILATLTHIYQKKTNPTLLLQKLQEPRFGHLHFPSEEDILVIPAH